MAYNILNSHALKLLLTQFPPPNPLPSGAGLAVGGRLAVDWRWASARLAQLYNSYTQLHSALSFILGAVLLCSILLKGVVVMYMLLPFAVFVITLLALFSLVMLYHEYSERKLKAKFKKLCEQPIYLGTDEEIERLRMWRENK